MTSPRRNIARDRAKEVFRGGDRDFHDGLKQADASFFARKLEGQSTGLFEGDLAGVNIVVGAKHQVNEDVDHGVAAENAALGTFPNAIFHTWDVFLWNDTLGDGVTEGDAVLHHQSKLFGFGRRHWFHSQHGIAILTATTSLLDELAANFVGLAAE